jgi:hypothetical protein
VTNDFDADGDALITSARRRSAAASRAELEALGSPATELGGSTRKVLTEHPLLRAMRQAEQHGARQRGLVRRRYRGPEPKAVLGGVPMARSARLKASRGG